MNRINRLQNGQSFRRLFLIGLSVFLLSITQIAQAGEHYPACNRGDKLITSVTNANANGESDYIGLVGPGCTYTVDKTLVIKADGGQPVTIEGNGSVISGANKVQVFNVEPGAVLILQNVIVQEGKSATGGGIYNRGTLTLTGTTLYSNYANYGGGLYNDGNTTIISSTVQGNRAKYSGGGLFEDAGVITVTNSFITLNEATYGGGAAILGGQFTVNNTLISGNHTTFSGGGIDNSGVTNLNNSLVQGNSTDGDGGGIYADIGKLNMIGSTLLENTAALGNGGGLFVKQTGTAALTSSTIALNSADYGGGMHNDGTLELRNVTVANNSATTTGGGLLSTAGTNDFGNAILAHNQGGDCVSSGQMLSRGGNWIGDASCIEGVLSGDPGLGPLTAASEFAPRYYPLNPASPAIDTGSNNTCALTDQRGAARPMDGNGDGNVVCDPGAFEADTVTIPIPSETATPGGPTATPDGSTATPTPPITPTAPAEEPGVELLSNGGFEQKDANTKAVLAPWTIKNGTGDKVKCNALYSKEGTCAFRFKGSAAENAKLTQNVKLDSITFTAGQTLDLSAFVSASTPTVSGKVKLSVKYIDPALSPEKISVDLKPTNGYEKLGGQVVLKSGSVAKIKLQVNHRSTSGKVFVDGVSLKQQPVEVLLLPLP